MLPVTPPLTIHATGPRDADTVWERYVETAQWSMWAPQIRSVEASDERLRAGTSGLVHGPLGVRVPFVVDAVDEDARRWSWTVRLAPLPVHLHLTHGVAARGTGSETWLRVRGPLPLVLGYLPLARLALHRLVR